MSKPSDPANPWDAPLRGIQEALTLCKPDDHILCGLTPVEGSNLLALHAAYEALKEQRNQAVQRFCRGEDKFCLVCGQEEPCTTEDPIPCTFDPTPMELHKENTRLRAEVEGLKAKVAEFVYHESHAEPNWPEYNRER